MRGGIGGGKARATDTAADDGHDQNGVDVVQSRRWRRRQRTDSARDRRVRRADGRSYRPDYHSVPYAQPLEGGGDVESACAVRQDALFAGVAAPARKHAESLHLAGHGDGDTLRPHGRTTARNGRQNAHGRRIRRTGSRRNRRNVPLGAYALRTLSCRRRTGGRRGGIRHHRITRSP